MNQEQLKKAAEEYVANDRKDYWGAIVPLMKNLCVEDRVRLITLFSFATNQAIREKIEREYKK